MAKRKIPITVGDILKIDLGDGAICFARALAEPAYAFYDLKVEVVPDLRTVILTPVLFTVWVMNHAVTSGRWEIIGNFPLEKNLEITPKFFKQDPINKKLCIYFQGKEIPASIEECEKLERAAVWEPGHIEDRLRDYFAGRPNQWVDLMKIK